MKWVWQWVTSPSYIPQTEQHLPFELMPLRLGKYNNYEEKYMAVETVWLILWSNLCILGHTGLDNRL